MATNNRQFNPTDHQYGGHYHEAQVVHCLSVFAGNDDDRHRVERAKLLTQTSDSLSQPTVHNEGNKDMNTNNTNKTADQLSEDAWEAFGRNAIDAEINKEAHEDAAFIAKGPDAEIKMNGVLKQRIADALTVAGMRTTVTEPTPRMWTNDNNRYREWSRPALKIEGFNGSIYLKIDQERTHHSNHHSKWRSSPVAGKWRIAYGDYGSTISFPQRKDGTHNYERIAELIIDDVARIKARQQKEATQAANKSGVEALRNKLGLEKYYGVMQLTPSAVEEKPFFVKVDIQSSMTAEQVIKLHEALVAAGIIHKKEG